MNRRKLETRSRSNSPQEIARGTEWTNKWKQEAGAEAQKAQSPKVAEVRRNIKLLKEKT